MKIESNTVVVMHYSLRDSSGQLLDSSEGNEPLAYLHGHGNIIPGLEKALEGKSAGEALTVVVSAEEGYGEYDDSQRFDVPLSDLSAIENLEEGMQLHMQSGDSVRVVTVAELHEGKAVLDGNHPLAGQELHFDIKIESLREPSKEELDHGHVHGAGGHHH